MGKPLKTNATAYHSILQKRLTAPIDRTGSPYQAFPELRCILSSHAVVPDITVIRQERVPTRKVAVEGAPGGIIEILSPRSKHD